MTDSQKSGLDAVMELLNNMSSLGDEVLQLWMDAFHFWLTLRKLRDAQKRERSLRAAVLIAGAAFEAFTNFLADRIVQAGEAGGRKLTEFEIDCLREKRKVLSAKGSVAEDTGRHSAKARFLLLFRLVSGGQEPPADMRSELDSCFRTRDELVHPKPGVSIRLDEDGKGEKAIQGFLKSEAHLSKVWGGIEFPSTPPHTFASLVQGEAVSGRN